MKTSSGGTNVLSLFKGSQRYVFIYDSTEESRRALLAILGRFAADQSMSFGWQDAAMLAARVTKPC